MRELLIKLLQIELCETAPTDVLSEDEIRSLDDPNVLCTLFHLSSPHDLQHMVGAVLYRIGAAAGTPIADSYKSALIAAAYRYEGRTYALAELSSFFEELGVDYILLKGAMLSKYYPLPEMRTSCDVDILIKREQLSLACRELTERLSYTKLKEGGHDVKLVSPHGVHLELHFTLAEEKDHSEAAKILRRVWDVAVPAEGSAHRMELPFDFAYFYHIAHMVKHFLYGGCGIRTVMDIYVLRNRCPGFDADAAHALVCQGGYADFENAMRQLANKWFGNTTPEYDDPDILARIEDFIMGGGIYGNTANRVKMNRAERKGRIGYLLSRLFLPYDHIKYDYPILQKHRLLLPFCQVHRWFRLFRGTTSKRIANEIRINHSITAEGRSDTQAMLKKLGL